MSDHAASRPGSAEYAPFYAGYVVRVPAGDILGCLEAQCDATLALLAAVPEARAGHRYASGKWSIREVVGHLADAERVMAYRALRFARADRAPLPGFDENHYVEQAGFDARTLADLAAELAAVRAATLALFRSLSPEAWLRSGIANDHPISVRALAYVIAGHELHHRYLLESRYLGAGSTVTAGGMPHGLFAGDGA
jgi:hypothetical protein